MKLPKSTILVTGATGYIASHTIIELLNGGYDVIGIDNLANSKRPVISRITGLTNRSMVFRAIDIRDKQQLSELFEQYPIDSVIHFAGYKAVGESVENPMLYYSNNLKGSINLFEVMQEQGVKSLVFSSSCTVYGNATSNPVTEESELNPTNPYGRTKFYVEQVLKDLSFSDNSWNIVSLRYFNPIGAHPSGLLGEDPSGKPNNLLPYITQTAIGKRQYLSVFGDDYDTKDGTCVRDYIHVTDIGKGHIKALEAIKNFTYEVFNLGTGKGYSVLEVIQTFEKVTGITIPFKIAERRSGDAAEVFADPTKAERKLGWKAQEDIVDMCRDAWNWQSKNPEGFKLNEPEKFSSLKKMYSSKNEAVQRKANLMSTETA